MEKNSKIYVAGHTGLVGSALLRKLQEKKYENIVYKSHYELDLREQKDTESFFKKEQPEYVFLAAAKVGGILANNTYKAEFIYDNIMISANIIHSAYKFEVKKLLNLGSSCVYPKFAPQPIKEEYLLTGNLEPTNEPYAIAKIAAMKLCRYYNEQYKTNFISVMPTNLYGPSDNFDLETAHVIPALIRKFQLAKLLRQNDYAAIRRDILKYPLFSGTNNKIDFENEAYIKESLKAFGITSDYVSIWGSGEPYREFLYVDELAEACIFLMEKYDYKDLGELINIGYGEEIKIKDLAKLIKDIIGFDGEIRFDASKPDGVLKKPLDISKIKKLGWESRIDFNEGLMKTIVWFKRKLN